jgi:flagellar basal body-associated protein FliL
MFGWDFENSKSDRVKLFLFILVTFLVVGFSVSTMFRSMNKQEAAVIGEHSKSEAESTENFDSDPTPSDHSEPESEKDQKNEYDQTEQFSEDTLEKTKEIAVQFVTSFHTYNADKPMEYLENAKPYMTDALYEKMKRAGRREVLERSYLAVKETQITPVVNKSSMVVRWNVITRGEAKSVDGKTSKTEDWYLVGLREVDGEWKVEDVRVNVPN